ncbi:hypothetical protein PoB_000278200 [Plakobranchus ocellatus]|uniref:Uncharacterized protein n=1 Tax=Plakobranchus ocellatus TaxID=259542 RepID=A0AAV3Y0I1_9GAST|nr:hypothetical protein PoB_000278200 [Plakobranchus ocellatus]
MLEVCGPDITECPAYQWTIEHRVPVAADLCPPALCPLAGQFEFVCLSSGLDRSVIYWTLMVKHQKHTTADPSLLGPVSSNFLLKPADLRGALHCDLGRSEIGL